MTNNEAVNTTRPKYVRDTELTKYLPFSLAKARKVSALANARIKVGKKAVLNDLDRIYAYIETLCNS